jgi:hypothetical protein
MSEPMPFMVGGNGTNEDPRRPPGFILASETLRKLCLHDLVMLRGWIRSSDHRTFFFSARDAILLILLLLLLSYLRGDTEQ